jgi:hypothetical protein
MNVRGELNVMKKIVQMLELFDYRARRRILGYVSEWVESKRPPLGTEAKPAEEEVAGS